MNHYSNFNTLQNKLGKLLAENNLNMTFDGRDYPVRLTITPDTSPEAQMEMFATATDGVTSPDAKLVYSMSVDGINVRTFGQLTLSDDLLTKIKNLAKKMYAAYCSAFHADRSAMGKTAANTADSDGVDSAESFEGLYDEDEDIPSEAESTEDDPLGADVFEEDDNGEE